MTAFSRRLWSNATSWYDVTSTSDTLVILRVGRQPLGSSVDEIDHGGRRGDGQNAHHDHAYAEHASNGTVSSCEVVVEHAKVYTPWRVLSSYRRIKPHIHFKIASNPERTTPHHKTQKMVENHSAGVAGSLLRNAMSFDIVQHLLEGSELTTEGDRLVHVVFGL